MGDPATETTPAGKIRLAWITANLDVGGLEGVLLALARGLDRARYEPHLLCVQAGGPLQPEFEALGVPVTIIPGFLRTPLGHLPSPRGLWRLARYLSRQRIQVVQTQLIPGNILGRIAARLARVPVVIASERNTHFGKSRRLRWAGKLLARRTDVIVSVSDAVRDFTARQDGIPPGKFLTIYNGLDLSRFDGSNRRGNVRGEWGIPDAAPVIGGVCRLVEHKNARFLVEEMPALLVRIPDLHCLLVGDGPMRRALEQRAVELGVQARVHFAGTRRDVPELLAVMDVVIHPSPQEGMPNAVLEAMAMARPVVANAFLAAPEIFTPGVDGFYVDFERDRPAARALILRLLTDPVHREAIGRAARRTVESRFRLDQMIDNYAALYERLYALKVTPPAR